MSYHQSIADSKWYYKRVDADNSTTTEITTENSTDPGIVTTENTTDTEIVTTENATDPEIVTTENATDPEITTEIVTENATEETTLPETGMSGSHKVFAGLSALMGITGIGLVKKIRVYIIISYFVTCPFRYLPKRIPSSTYLSD